MFYLPRNSISKKLKIYPRQMNTSLVKEMFDIFQFYVVYITGQGAFDLIRTSSSFENLLMVFRERSLQGSPPSALR